ncbi:MAG: flagellar basal body L-ring protein FlgH [Gammaproteobacteria bacterium]|jgi:flagellar L-ring protein precursor FlgH
MYQRKMRRRVAGRDVAGRARALAGVVAVSALAACASSPLVEMTDDYAAVMPPSLDETSVPGAVYNVQRQFSLFDDLRSRNIGDILTIRLVEQTQASKSATTDTSRGTSIDTGSPVILGRTITQDGRDLLNSSIDTDQTFAGAGSSTQSNELIGDITVTVAQVLSNGNLVVRGEKQLTLNQGEEFIRISGIVRPADIAPDNSVPSLRLADARITYSGKGQIANTNRPGWLHRFFNSVAWPF